MARTLTVLLALTGCAGGTQEDGSRPSPSERPEHRYVSGGGALADDWSDEGLLGENLPAHSDLVAMWQTVLWSDGYLKRPGIDCHYAKATREATRTWQGNRSLPADGIVGPQTFAAAGERLVRREGMVIYRGEQHSVSFRRADDGRYLVEDSGTYKPLRRDRATLEVCAKAKG
ncbi:peptidoglycan-binding domain-containing protein [Streptomyces sp. NPDC054796]